MTHLERADKGERKGVKLVHEGRTLLANFPDKHTAEQSAEQYQAKTPGSIIRDYYAHISATDADDVVTKWHKTAGFSVWK